MQPSNWLKVSSLIYSQTVLSLRHMPRLHVRSKRTEPKMIFKYCEILSAPQKQVGIYKRTLSNAL